jgi:hypothetical protein
VTKSGRLAKGANAVLKVVTKFDIWTPAISKFFKSKDAGNLVMLAFIGYLHWKKN